MTRPPVQNPSTLTSQQKEGENLFEQNCASCHIQELPIYNPRVLIATPPTSPSDGGKCPTEAVTLSNSYSENGEDLEVIKQYKGIKDKLLQLVSATSDDSESSTTALNFEKAFKAVMEEEGNNSQVAYGSSQGYSISLNPSKSDDLPAYVYGNYGSGRLPVDDSTGNISVPLYSDLRTHNMGQGLADIVPQGSDVADIQISQELFLTRPLWGVADTGPWLHDGRARTLEEAILRHADSSSLSECAVDNPPENCSEAAGAVNAVNNPDDLDAIVQFLLTLQLPVQDNLQIDNVSSNTASSSSSNS